MNKAELKKKLTRLEVQMVRNHAEDIRQIRKMFDCVERFSEAKEQKNVKVNNRLIEENKRLKDEVESLIKQMHNINPNAKMTSYTKEEVIESLEKFDGVRELAAEHMGIKVMTLYSAIRRLGIKVPVKRVKRTVNGEVKWLVKKKYK